MTEKEFLALAPRQQDAVVARWMGWVDLGGVWQDPGDALWTQTLPPAFTTSISAAWEVVDKMESAGWGWTADRRSIAGEPFEYPWRFHKGAEIHRAGCNTAPLAICIAALKAVGAIE